MHDTHSRMDRCCGARRLRLPWPNPRLRLERRFLVLRFLVLRGRCAEPGDSPETIMPPALTLPTSRSSRPRSPASRSQLQSARGCSEIFTSSSPTPRRREPRRSLPRPSNRSGIHPAAPRPTCSCSALPCSCRKGVRSRRCGCSRRWSNCSQIMRKPGTGAHSSTIISTTRVAHSAISGVCSRSIPIITKALEGLALLMAETGEKKSALKAFDKLLSVYPTMPGVKARRDELAKELEGQGI